MKQIAIILIPVAGLSLLTPLLAARYGEKRARPFFWCAFFVYALGNLYFTLLSRTPGMGGGLGLLPFRTYGSLFEKAAEELPVPAGFAGAFLASILPIDGLILNILLYYPLGYLLSVLFPRLRPWQVVLIGCTCSVATEAAQYVFQMGWCETDDVIHNTLGTALGVWVWHLQCRRIKKRADGE